jgi:hypothetical protein
MDDVVRFTEGASQQLVGIPNAFLRTVLEGIIKQAKVRDVELVDEDFVIALNKEREEAGF